MDPFDMDALAKALDGKTLTMPVPAVFGLVGTAPGLIPAAHYALPHHPPHDMRHLAAREIDPLRPYGALRATPAPYRPPALRAVTAPVVPAVTAPAVTAPAPYRPPGGGVQPLCSGCRYCDYASRACAAGIFIIDTDAHGRKHLILVQERETKQYSEPGGRFDTGDGDILTTAQRETLEETRNCANISKSQLASARLIDKRCGRHKYRAYFVHTSGISCSKFYKTDVSRLPAVYQETCAMTRFPLDVMKAQWASTGNIVFTADDGTVKSGRGRCTEMLQEAFRTGVL